MKKCSACGKEIDTAREGIELWNSWYCSTCFIGRSQEFHRELRPEDIELLKIIGRELAGLLPPELVEMIVISYYRRASGSTGTPPKEETLRVVGEIQRLAAFAIFRKTLSLLRTWQDSFNEFVEEQETEIREHVRQLTDPDA